MGRFFRKALTTQLQIPDRIGLAALELYGRQDFRSALEQYAEAIDRLHTMYVMTPAPSRKRTPGASDQSILDGFESALGATLAIDPSHDVSLIVQRSVSYLLQIAQATGASGDRYIKAAQRFERTYKLGRR